MIDITLTPDEIQYAATAGVMRRVDSMKANLTNRRYSDASDWDIDIEGACAELAVAKAMNVFWNGHMRTFKGPDVGDLHVRSTTHANGHLIIRDNDDENAVYVLVICDCPRYKIVGGISGKRARRDFPRVPNKGGEGASHWVPQDDLSDIDRVFAAFGKK